MEPERIEYPEIGARLAALRLAFEGAVQKEWAEKHSFSPSRYNNWEKGVRRISLEAAELLADRYGVTLDWIYRGRADGLSENSLKRISSHLAINLTT